jgi:hypothetical protein
MKDKHPQTAKKNVRKDSSQSSKSENVDCPPWIQNSSFYLAMDQPYINAVYLYYKSSLKPKPKSEDKPDEIEQVGNQPILIKLMFDDEKRHLRVKQAKLVTSYLESNDRVKQLAFFWTFWLKFNDLTGTKHGHLSSMTYLFMLITFLQKQFHLDKAQVFQLKSKPDDKGRQILELPGEDGEEDA